MTRDLLDFQLFGGESEKGKQKWPLHFSPAALTDPKHYLLDKPLQDAVKVALLVGRPLLLTGDPGTGKTQLAYSLAYQLEGLGEPLVFNAKTTSTARDLFYRYDSLRHFHDSQFKEQAREINEYVEYEVLGIAAHLSQPREKRPPLPDKYKGLPQTRVIVLIDEIDKAPRDLPNDILNEIDELSFKVKETGEEIRFAPDFRPFLIFTSNSEKTLPEPFLRRCVYYHIPPPEEARLVEIVQHRLGVSGGFTPKMLGNAVALFVRIRDEVANLKKKPATAELLDWIRVLAHHGIDVKDPRAEQREAFEASVSAIAKMREDREKILTYFKL